MVVIDPDNDSKIVSQELSEELALNESNYFFKQMKFL